MLAGEGGEGQDRKAEIPVIGTPIRGWKASATGALGPNRGPESLGYGRAR